MKRVFLFSVLMGATISSGAQTDSLLLEKLQEVTIQGVTVQKDAPFAVTDLNRKELDSFSKTGRELPFLFSRTPGVMSWSENGVGTGTVYMRIRGAADSRINVTLDGVPLNSPEDQCVFWANMNSYGSLLGSAQIQRGVGSSTNGDGAFGGSVALSSKIPSPEMGGEVSASYGSFNTMNLGGNFSSGLLLDHLIVDGAYHHTQTDGYVHGTAGKSGSWYGGLAWLGDNFVVRYRSINNYEQTGQAWNGVTAGNDDLSLMDGIYGSNTGIHSYADLYKVGLGKYNSLYEMYATDADGNFAKDASGNYQTVRYTMADGSNWDKTTDNFWQSHNILSMSWDINENWQTTAALHYTYGYGYYEEFRYNNKLKKFGLSNYTTPGGSTVKKSDFVRKKGLSQNTGGLVWSAKYTSSTIDITTGLSAQMFQGNHFGLLTYAGNADLASHLLANGAYQYYDSDARKNDISSYIKASWHLSESLDAFTDIQYRHVGYVTDGYNDKFIDNGDGTYSKHYLDIDQKYNFINPKFGLSYHKDGHKAYASVATSNREPERNNFTDNGNKPAPKAERVNDFEAGYVYSGTNWFVNLNAYYMDYRNQFVQTGEKSDIGENLTTNIERSYRTGIELSAGVSPLSWLDLEANAALSSNRIKDFDEYVENWDDWSGNTYANGDPYDGDGFDIIHYDNSTLAYSPSAILNGFITVHNGRWAAQWHTGYVSRQYLDNSENKERSLDAYTVSDLQFSYVLPVGKKELSRQLQFSLNLNNVFNAHYAASGWVYSAIAESYGHSNNNRYYQIGYIPMAGFNAMGSVTFRF